MTESDTHGQLTTKHWVIIFLSVIAVITMIVIFVFIDNKQLVDINQYLVVNHTGFDGYGAIEITIDYNKLMDEYIVDNYRADKVKDKIIELCSNTNPFVAKCDAPNTLHNGDVVDIYWERNEDAIKELEKLLNVKFSSKVFKYTVQELDELKDYDPFKDLAVDINNIVSECGELDFSIHPILDGENIVLNVSHDGIDGSIKNGDILTLTIADDVDIDNFAKKTGLRITKMSEKYVVSCLGEYAKDGTVLQHIGNREKEAFDQVINDWVVAGLNDENQVLLARTYEPAGYLFYTNGALTEEKSESMLFCIYHINDRYVSDGYYVFIGLKGVFSYNDSGVFINSGDALPTSFAHYEKEAVRYSETSGWQHGCESMGFLYNEMPYAGHRDIQETFEYIESVYGANYSARYTSDDIENIVPTR